MSSASQVSLRSVYDCVRGYLPSPGGSQPDRLFGKPVSQYQARMVYRYVETGRLTATGGRGGGKSFTLGLLAALELEAGHSVLYRTGMGQDADRHGGETLLATVDWLLGKGKANAARAAGRIQLPAGRYDYVSGLSVTADLRDEVWLGGYFRKVRAERVAMVGSLPDDTIEVRSDARHNLFIPEEYRAAFARVYPDPVAHDTELTLSRVQYVTPLKPLSPVAPEDDVAPCYTVGPS